MKNKRKISIYEIDNGVEFSINFESDFLFSKALKYLNRNLDIKYSEERTSSDREYAFVLTLAEYSAFKAHMDGA